MKDYVGKVKVNRVVEEDVHMLELEVPGFDGVAEAGQFVMARAGRSYDPFLRRPYSIFDCGKESMQLLVKIVGKGSASIATKQVGSTIEFLGPLGTGFSVAKQGHHLLAAGGMGIAPLWFLARRLERIDAPFTLIFGEQTHSKIGSMVENGFRNVHLVTDDGSYGIRGVATEALLIRIDKHREAGVTVYGCGPPAMLRRLAEVAKEREIPVYISLEERMACGVGVCMGCSVRKSDGSGYSTVCRDGPVFLAHKVIW
jgi:dihydroorotate dehydrogenase electron transfer subunit